MTKNPKLQSIENQIGMVEQTIIALKSEASTLTQEDLDPLLTAKEVSLHLRCSQKNVYDMATIGEIPCIRVGRLIRFKRSAIDNLGVKQ